MSHTIAAVSTGHVVSAIGIIRLTGDGCIQIADRVFALNNKKSLTSAPDRKMLLGELADKQGRTIDSCCVIVSRGPHSYTGEDTVEFHCHGSPAVLAAGLEALYNAGALPAKRGEFTKRAFLNGKLDLTQAEAVIDLIEADTADAAANAAGQVGGVLQKKLAPIYDSLVDLCSHFHAVLDYPDEDIPDFGLDNYYKELRADAKTLYALLQTYGQGRILRQGVAAAIVGKPNVGKSSLLNALAGYDRCIVTDIPGTTRDTVEETVMLGPTRLRLIDTAGIRETEDTVERIGVERSRAALAQAELVLALVDSSRELSGEDMAVLEQASRHEKWILIWSKSDLEQRETIPVLRFDGANCAPAAVVELSSVTGEGMDDLERAVAALFPAGETPAGQIITNARQSEAMERAAAAIAGAKDALDMDLTPDAVLTDVESAMAALGELTGRTVREDIVGRIFERFCVGK